MANLHLEEEKAKSIKVSSNLNSSANRHMTTWRILKLLQALTWKKVSSQTGIDFLSLVTGFAILIVTYPALSSSVVTPGSRDYQVALIQKVLQYKGYYPHSITKYYGSTTQNAVSNFQQKHGLQVDGIAGPMTQSRLTGLTYSTAHYHRHYRTTNVAYQPYPVPSTSVSPCRLLLPNGRHVLHRGDSCSDVADLQRSLANQGLFNGAASGVLGPQTEQAVKSFQASHNLVGDGVVGASTWQELDYIAINNPPTTNNTTPRTLRRGSTGSDVADLQRFLKSQGLFNGPASASFGPFTEQAVKSFQARHNLATTGIVGPSTWSELANAGFNSSYANNNYGYGNSYYNNNSSDSSLNNLFPNTGSGNNTY